MTASSLPRSLDRLARQRMFKTPWSIRLSTTLEPRNPVDPVTSTGCPKSLITSLGSMTTGPRHERQYVEAIVLELEELLANLLDAVPRLCPILRSRSPEDGCAANLGTSGAQHSTIYEGRAPTPKAGCHDDE